MIVPSMGPVIFIGTDLEPGDSGQVYFQDVDSYRREIRYGTADEKTNARFLRGSQSELGHLFNYEQALEVLMACSLRRRKE